MSNPLIYLVDDDDDDRYLIQSVFSSHYERCAVRAFESGSDLLIQLTHQLDGRLPDLIILDLDMPLFSGFELLRRLKQDEDFQAIPVAVLSGSLYDEHKSRCYALGGAAYLSKSLNVTHLSKELQHLEPYWTQRSLRQSSVTVRSRPQISGLDLSCLPLN